LEDLKDYLYDLTLVGGWVPFVYTRFLWKNVFATSVTTVDIDFGFGEVEERIYPKTIFDMLSSLDYNERHLTIGKLYPVVLYKGGQVPLDFITFPEISDDVIEKFIGRQININKIDRFDFLLNHRIPVNIKTDKQKAGYTIYCPKPSAFLYHKGAVFNDREDEHKQAKDLHYMYFILRYAPDVNIILEEVVQYRKKGYFENISKNLNRYFERKSSQGCLMVEKENGPDDYVDDLREDIFKRFKILRELF
jgi:hypothetical protein